MLFYTVMFYVYIICIIQNAAVDDDSISRVLNTNSLQIKYVILY